MTNNESAAINQQWISATDMYQKVVAYTEVVYWYKLWQAEESGDDDDDKMCDSLLFSWILTI